MFSFEKKNKNLYSNKITRSPFTVEVFWIISALCFFAACKNIGNSSKSNFKKQIQINDSLVIDAHNVFKIYTTIIKKANVNEDSLLLLLDKSSSILYKIDTGNKIINSVHIPQSITADLIGFAFKKGKYYLLSEKGLKVFSSNLESKAKEYAFDLTDAIGFHTVAAEFKIMDDESFLIYKLPKCNMSNSIGRHEYFNSKIVCKAKIKEGNPYLITKDLIDIKFPLLYSKEIYKDLYPTFNSCDQRIVYTFQYWDSIVLIQNNLKERYAIPKQFSVSAKPMPEEYFNSKTKSEEYFSTHNSNIKLLNFEDKILVFQLIGADRYEQEETGTLNDYLSLNKKMILFDLAKRHFDGQEYELPPNCNPVKSCIFNNQLYLFSANDERRSTKIYITNL